MDEDPEEGQCAGCGEAKGESRVGKEVSVHFVTRSRSISEENSNQEVIGALEQHNK